MARSTRYATDEERLEARRRSRREYYARNLETERTRARERWNTRSHAREGRPREEKSAQETLLPVTCTIIGVGLQVEEDSFLGPLTAALEEDLASWSGGLHVFTVCERFAYRLIREERRRGTRSPRLHRNIAIKMQHAQFVEDVGQQAARIAWLRGGDDSMTYLALQDIRHRAVALVSELEELIAFSELGDGTLKREYEAGKLIYQGR